jgi:hypothetical protein
LAKSVGAAKTGVCGTPNIILDRTIVLEAALETRVEIRPDGNGGEDNCVGIYHLTVNEARPQGEPYNDYQGVYQSVRRSSLHRGFLTLPNARKTMR